MIALGYCVIKIFFANIKRSGILFPWQTEFLLGIGIMLVVKNGETVMQKWIIPD